MFQAKKAVRIPLILFAAALSAPSIADPDHHFIVFNSNKDLSIERVWFVHDGLWVEVKGKVDIKPKTSATFTVYTSPSCLFDVKIQFADGFTQQWENVNVCTGETVTAT